MGEAEKHIDKPDRLSFIRISQALKIYNETMSDTVKM